MMLPSDDGMMDLLSAARLMSQSGGRHRNASPRQNAWHLERISYLRLVQWVDADQYADDVEVSSRMSARRG